MQEMMTHTGDDATIAAEQEASQYLTFEVAQEAYAIDILEVREIIEMGRMTRVPMTPEHIRGVINLRGNVVPVVDLSARLGKTVSKLTKRSCIVLVELAVGDDRQSLGMLVDEVKEILEIPPANLQTPPSFGTDIRTDFIQAMGRVDEDFMIILNVNHVLSVDELSNLKDLSDSAGSGLANRQEHLDSASYQANNLEV